MPKGAKLVLTLATSPRRSRTGHDGAHLPRPADRRRRRSSRCQGRHVGDPGAVKTPLDAGGRARPARHVQLGRRGAAPGLVSARRLDGRGAAAVLRGAVRRGRGRLAVLRAARPGGDGALGPPHAGRVHVPRQGERGDDVARGPPTDAAFASSGARSSRSSCRGSCRGVLLQYHPRFVKSREAKAELARAPDRLAPARATGRVPPPLVDGAGGAGRHARVPRAPRALRTCRSTAR